MHVLIILNLLIFALIGLWVLRRMWAISAAERRERKLERREQKAAEWAEGCERERRAYATAEQHAREAAEERRQRLAYKREVAEANRLGWGSWVACSIGAIGVLTMLFGHALFPIGY